VNVSAFAAHVNLTVALVRATVLEGPDADCWSEAERVLIATTDALHERAKLSDAEFAALRAHYDEAQILEVLLLCGFYRTVSYISNGLKLPLEETAARFPKA
jgi:alkylhydroperoxidase family enzyme